jgi:nitrate/nitrite transporter NarK
MPSDSRGQYYASEESNSDAQVASAARTATGTSSAFATADTDHLTATLVVTAASGTTPTLDVTLETTADGTNYYTVPVTFPQQTGTTTGVARVFGSLGATSRWKWTIGGTTPSFTFSIAVTADRDD